MNSILGLSSGLSGITNGQSAVQSASMQKDSNEFNDLVKSLMNTATLSTEEVKDGSRLNGDYTSDFSVTDKSESMKNAKPVGAAANSTGNSALSGTIDKTSKLYEKSLELESYFVKIMLSSMRNTVSKSGLLGSENEYASKMYEDMLYDEYSVAMTKNAGFGLADQIYLQMV